MGSSDQVDVITGLLGREAVTASAKLLGEFHLFYIYFELETNYLEILFASYPT